MLRSSKRFSNTVAVRSELAERPPRAACGGGESGAGAPAVRPQHVEAERERTKEEQCQPQAKEEQCQPQAKEEQCQPQAKEEQCQPQAKKRQFSSRLMSSECTRTKRSAFSPSTKGRGEKSVTWLRERNKVIEEKSIR